jgi:GTP-binding protein
MARAGVELALAKNGAVSGSEVVIGAGPSAVIFDWQPTVSDLHQGPRGTDERLVDMSRPNAAQRLIEHRRRQYGEAYDGGEEESPQQDQGSEDVDA